MTKESLLKALEDASHTEVFHGSGAQKSVALHKAIALVKEHLGDEGELLCEIKRLENLVYVPGLWKCALCKCTLVCTNLHADTGGFSANNSPQHCPNNCGPMWRVTERDAGNDLIDHYENQSTTPHGKE